MYGQYQVRKGQNEKVQSAQFAHYAVFSLPLALPLGFKDQSKGLFCIILYPFLFGTDYIGM